MSKHRPPSEFQSGSSWDASDAAPEIDDDAEPVVPEPQPLRPGTFRASNGVTLALSAKWDFTE